MKQRRGYIIMMLCAGLLLTLWSCGDDASDDREQRTQELRVTFGSPAYRSTDAATRAGGDLPASFKPYDHVDSLQPISQIQCYMTYLKDESQTYIPCQFDHTATGSEPVVHTWTTKVALYTGTNYYLYGFMPKEKLFVQKGGVTSGASIAPYGGDYANGAVITFTGLNAVIPNDLCVIVGAKGWGIDPASIPDMSSRLGKFNYNPDTDGTKLFLLADHLYAGLRFNIRLDSAYNALRDKLKPENGNNNVIEHVDAVVTITANNANQNPMSVVFENITSGKNPQPAEIYGGEGKLLTIGYQAFMACFWPGSTNTKFTLETTYDVLDKKNNVVREDQKASNAISLEYGLTAGKVHDVRITVKPTFLYVLSDPDLDDPTFVVN